MSGLFHTVFNMSITASYASLVVILVRLLLKKAPKIFSYLLWIIVGFRLVCPFTIQSPLSIVLPQKYRILNDMPSIQKTFDGKDFSGGAITSTISSSSQIAMQFADAISILWIVGIVVLLYYVAIRYFKLKNKLSTATLVQDNIYETDRITSAFVLGSLKPKIYFPVGLNEQQFNYILKHEQTHIKRKDYLIKLISFLVLTIHWFNPFIWLSYFLMVKDMEMSCDESVVSKNGQDIRVGYSKTLLFVSEKQNGLLLSLGFGESNTKLRIKNILNYKKPKLWVIIISISAIVAVITLGLITNPFNNQVIHKQTSDQSLTQTLLNNKTKYVGDVPKVVALARSLPVLEGITWETISLKTAEEPYGITIDYQISDYDCFGLDDTISGFPFFQNSMILMSLIDNVDSVTYRIKDDDRGAIYSFPATRDQAEDIMKCDVRKFADSEESLKKLLEFVCDLTPEKLKQKYEQENDL